MKRLFILLAAVFFIGCKQSPSDESTEAASVSLGDHLAIVSYNPPLPATLGMGENLEVIIDYRIDSVEQAQIWARPQTSGRPTPGYGAHPSPSYQKGEGSLVGWFRFRHPTIVDEVLVTMVARTAEGKMDTIASISETIEAEWIENEHSQD